MTTFRFLLPLDLTITKIEWLEGGKADDGSEWLNFEAQAQVIGVGLCSSRTVRGTIVRDDFNFRAPTEVPGECELTDVTKDDVRVLLGGHVLFDMAGWWVVDEILTAAVNQIASERVN